MEPIKLFSTNQGIYVYKLWLVCVIVFRLRSDRICCNILRFLSCGLDAHTISFTRNTRLILDWRYILTKTNPQMSGEESFFRSWQSRNWQVILPLHGTRISHSIFTRPGQWTLSWVEWIQCTASHTFLKIHLISILLSATATSSYLSKFATETCAFVRSPYLLYS